jgi:hypothetical protein
MTENAPEIPDTDGDAAEAPYVDTPVQDDEAEQEATDAPDAD